MKDLVYDAVSRQIFIATIFCPYDTTLWKMIPQEWQCLYSETSQTDGLEGYFTCWY